MTVKCPKCGYLRRPSDDHVSPLICPDCGIAYSKWLKQQSERIPASAKPHTSEEQTGDFWAFITYVPDAVNPVAFAGRALIWLGLFCWGWLFIVRGIDWVSINSAFMHNINLPFHEFGHVLFSPFGRFMHILGGSLFQVLLPLGLVVAFLYYNADTFGASVMLWWAGQSLLDISPYIADAPYRMMPLVGGGGEESHDWGNLLTMMNLVDYARPIARMDFGLGALIMLIASFWSLVVLLKQSKKLNSSASF